MTTPKQKAVCSCCGVLLTNHASVIQTCRKLEKARSALKIIHTWASFRGGEMLTEKPQDTADLCRKTLVQTI